MEQRGRMGQRGRKDVGFREHRSCSETEWVCRGADKTFFEYINSTLGYYPMLHGHTRSLSDEALNG